MTDLRKFAGVVSQCRKAKSRLMQYLVNLANDAFFELPVRDTLE
jgi:hypothetical protein